MAITFVLEVDWDDDGDFGDTGEDITSVLWAVECERGRNYASQLTGRAQAGRLVATLDDRVGDYAPFNTSSPIAGDVVPARRVRLRATAPVAATIWTGFLDRIQPQREVGKHGKAVLYASGALGRLNGKRVNPPASSGAATGTLIGLVLDDVGWPAGDRIIDAGQTVTGRWFVQDKDALAAIRELEETELGFFHEGLDWDIVYEDRHHRLKGDHLSSQATYSDVAGAAIVYQRINELDPLREIFNEIPVTIRTFTLLSLAVVWTLNESNPTLGPGESKTWWAKYPNDATPAGAYVEAWTTPVVGTDVTQTGVANGDIAIAVDKFANSMKITVTNNHATATATLTLIQARGTAVTADEPVRVVAEDATSQATYGKRTFRLPGPWYPNTSEAQSLAEYLVSRYKDPLATLDLAFKASRDSTMETQALQRDLSELITVIAENDVALGINSLFFIEAIRHQINFRDDRAHWVTLKLSQSEGDQGFWILGTSLLGETTKLAF